LNGSTIRRAIIYCGKKEGLLTLILAINEKLEMICLIAKAAWAILAPDSG